MPFKFADIPGVFQERKPPTPIDFSGLHQWAQNQQANKRQAEELKFAREQEQRIRDEAAATRALQTRFHEDDLQLKMTDYFAQMEAEQHKRRIAQEKALNDATADALQAGWGRNYDVIETQIAERVRQAGGQLRWVNETDGKATPIEQLKPAAPALPGDVPMPATPTEKPAPKLTQPMTPEEQATAAKLDAIDTTMPGAPAPPALPGDVPMPQEQTEKPAPSELKKATRELSETVTETQQRMGPNSSVSISTTVKPEEKGPSKAVEVGGQEDPRDNARLELVRPDGSVVTLYSPEIRREQHRQAFDEFVADGEQGLVKPGDKADWQAAWSIVRGSGRPYAELVKAHDEAYQNFQKWRYAEQMGLARISAARAAQSNTGDRQDTKTAMQAWQAGRDDGLNYAKDVKLVVNALSGAQDAQRLLSRRGLTRGQLYTITASLAKAAGNAANSLSNRDIDGQMGNQSFVSQAEDFMARNGLNVLTAESEREIVGDRIVSDLMGTVNGYLEKLYPATKGMYQSSIEQWRHGRATREFGDQWGHGWVNGTMAPFQQAKDGNGKPIWNQNDFGVPVTPGQIQGSAAAATDPSQEDPEFNDFLQGSGN